MLVDIINEQCVKNEVILIILNNRVSSSLINRIDKKVNVNLLGRKEGSINPIPIIKLNCLLIKEKPDLIHSHSHELVNICIFTRIIVLTVHATDIPSKNLKRYNKVFAISNSVKNYIHDISGINSTLVYNGIKTVAIKRKLEGSLMKNDRLTKLVQVGRLDHKVKGQHLSILALKLLKDKGYNMYLDFIGDGVSRSFLEQLVNENELQQNVRFLNTKDRDYLYENLCNYDILLQPSLIEGFGLTIIEAITAQLQIVVSDTEGPKEINEFLNYGICFRTGDYEELANAIEKVSFNPQKITSEILDKLSKNFDVAHTANRYVEEYYKLLN